MIRSFFLFLLVTSFILYATPTQEMQDLEGNHLKVILQQKNANLLNGQFNYAIAAAEMMINGEKVTKLIKYSICENKDGSTSFYAEKEDHSIFILSYPKQEGENTSVLAACHIIKNDEIVGQIDIVLSYSESMGYSLKTNQNISTRETVLLSLCANEFKEKVLAQAGKHDVAGNMHLISNYLLTRVYGKITGCKFENLASEVIIKETENDPNARYSTRCLGRHSYYGLICIIKSGIYDITTCAKAAGACGCYEAIWYYTTVYMCTTICQ